MGTSLANNNSERRQGKKGKEDCQKAAVFQGYPFKRTKNVRDYPKGCYLDIWNDGVYWNPNKDGRSHMAAAEICYGHGNYCRTPMIKFS